jgi:hypothetical protein
MDNVLAILEQFTKIVGALTILVTGLIGLLKLVNVLIRRSRFLANSLVDFFKKGIGFRRARKDGTVRLDS